MARLQDKKYTLFFRPNNNKGEYKVIGQFSVAGLSKYLKEKKFKSGYSAKALNNSLSKPDKRIKFKGKYYDGKFLFTNILNDKKAFVTFNEDHVNNVPIQRQLNNNVKLSYRRGIDNKINGNRYTFNNDFIIDEKSISTFLNFVKKKIAIYSKKEIYRSYYRIILFGSDGEKMSTTFGDYNQTLDNLYDKLQEYISQYIDEMEIKSTIIERKKVPKIEKRLLFGVNNTKTFLDDFLKNKLLVEDNDYQRKKILGQFPEYVKNMHELKEFISNNTLINNVNNKNCIIHAFVYSYLYSYSEMKKYINKGKLNKKDFDENVEKMIRSTEKKVCEYEKDIKLEKRLQNRTLENLGTFLCKLFQCNMHVTDINNMETYEINKYKNKKIVKMAIFGSHAYGLMKRTKENDEFELERRYCIDFVGQKLIKNNEEKVDKENYELYTYDIETYAKEMKEGKSSMIPYAIGTYYYNKEKKEYIYKDFFACDHDDIVSKFIEYIYNAPGKEKILYAHNGGKFDAYLLIKKLIEKKNIRIEKILDKNGRLIDITTKQIIDNETKTVIFRDSYTFINSSLDSACKSFKTDTVKLKDTVDHNKITEDNYDTEKTKDYVKQYLKNDCICLREILRKFEKIISENFKYSISMKSVLTNASIARELYNKYYNPEKYPIYTIDEKLYEELSKYYFGGRNEIFTKIGLINEKLYYYDFTSLYPFMMKINLFPYGPMKMKTSNVKYDKNAIGFYKVKIRHDSETINEETEIPLIGIYEDNKYIFPYLKTYYEMILTTAEINYIKNNDLGYEIIFLESYLYEKRAPLFKKIITDLYTLKEEARNKGKDVLAKTAKIIINSSYGFWGMKKHTESINISAGKKNEKNEAELINILTSGNLIDHKSFDNYEIYKQKKRVESNFMNVGIAMFITAYARLHLYDLMKKIKNRKGKIYYCDTDSIITNFCIETCPKLRKEYMEGGSEIIGNLKNEVNDLKDSKGKFGDIDVKDEYHLDSAIFNACKVYAIRKQFKGRTFESTKLKGLNIKNKYKKFKIDEKNKKLIYEDISEFEGKYSINYDTMKLMSEGYTLMADNMSINANTNIIFGDKKVTKHDNIKKISQQYQKATTKNKKITPIVYEDIEDLEFGEHSDDDCEIDDIGIFDYLNKKQEELNDKYNMIPDSDSDCEIDIY